MKRVICLCLNLILILSLVPVQVRAATNSVTCHPGETIEVAFILSEYGDQPDGVMGQLQYDTDIFTVIPSQYLIGTDGINILNRQPVTISFRVNKYAPAGQYTIEIKVIEAVDADGKKYTNARINPVQVTVMSAATAATEHTSAPMPTDKPLTLPSAAGTSRKQMSAPMPTDKPLTLPSAAGTSRKQIKAGDYVTFGHYPQTAAGDDETAIEWLVLDVQGDKALLLSRYGLNAKQYNTQYTSVTWETSTLRNWLNEEFLSKAFNSEEQGAIRKTNVDNSKSQGYGGWSTDGGNNTEDKIFLLSYAEAKEYLGVQHSSVTDSEKNIKSRISPTEYAKKQGAYTDSNNKTTDGSEAGYWWLRSPGYDQLRAARVFIDGSLYSYSVHYGSAVVRPALWINLDAGII